MQALEFFLRAFDIPCEDTGNDAQPPSIIERIALECAGFQHIRYFHEFIGRRRFRNVKELVLIECIILEERTWLAASEAVQEENFPRTGYERLDEDGVSVPDPMSSTLEMLTVRDSDEYLDALYHERCPMDMGNLKRLQLLESQLETVDRKIGKSLTHLRIGMTQFDRLEPNCLPNVTHYCLTLSSTLSAVGINSPADILAISLYQLNMAAPNLKYLIMEIESGFNDMFLRTMDPILANVPLPGDAQIIVLELAADNEPAQDARSSWV
ncbi:hypothetical protein VNI00_010530 [Paramarasmius palmivorus]|uniref:Uncharacterized protein n=1 Tax=Paramarasmius palmivorus TaxID=297713 RepID=A0AAW0CKS6_9AGAR